MVYQVSAACHGYPTVSYAPLRSLRGAALRDDFVVVGEEFGDEANALGASPDILFVLGGDRNAEKELEAALRMGTKVVLLTLKTYPDRSVAYIHERHADAQDTGHKDNLKVCKSAQELEEYLRTLKLTDLQANREQRATYLKGILAASQPELFGDN